MTKLISVSTTANAIVCDIMDETRTDIANHIDGNKSRNPDITRIDGIRNIEALVNQQVLQALEKVKSKSYEQRVRNDESSLGSHLTVVRLSAIEEIEKEYK